MNTQLYDCFDNIFDYCFRLFKDKNKDYGLSWLLYRYQSLNDEIWRKAKRIRTLEEHDDQACIPEGRDVEYVGIINYCIMFLIKLEHSLTELSDEQIVENLAVLDGIGEEQVHQAYSMHAAKVKALLIRKNTDYGDAWQSMSLAAMTDQVIIRVYRIRKILENKGVLLSSEGIEAQLHDIINYSVFALIKMQTAIALGK